MFSDHWNDYWTDIDPRFVLKNHENEEVIVAECGVEFLNWENTLCQVSAIMQRVQGLWGNMRKSALCFLGVEVR